MLITERNRAECADNKIADSVLIEDLEHMVSLLHALNDMGVRVTIHDFGTGFFSLRCSKHLPINALKIDRSFVRNIVKDVGDVTTVKAGSTLPGIWDARHRQGIETREQLQIIERHSYDVFQGFPCSHPVKGEAVAPMLRNPMHHGLT